MRLPKRDADPVQALHALELTLARETARREAAERHVERLLVTLGAAIQTGRAPLAPPLVVADAPPVGEAPTDAPAFPPALVAVCKRFDDGRPEQFTRNLHEARRLLARGLKVDEVAHHIMRGEQVTP